MGIAPGTVASGVATRCIGLVAGKAAAATAPGGLGSADDAGSAAAACGKEGGKTAASGLGLDSGLAMGLVNRGATAIPALGDAVLMLCLSTEAAESELQVTGEGTELSPRNHELRTGSVARIGDTWGGVANGGVAAAAGAGGHPMVGVDIEVPAIAGLGLAPGDSGAAARGRIGVAPSGTAPGRGKPGVTEAVGAVNGRGLIAVADAAGSIPGSLGLALTEWDVGVAVGITVVTTLDVGLPGGIAATDASGP